VPAAGLKKMLNPIESMPSAKLEKRTSGLVRRNMTNFVDLLTLYHRRTQLLKAAESVRLR
jgi:hypothetical protein